MVPQAAVTPPCTSYMYIQASGSSSQACCTLQAALFLEMCLQVHPHVWVSKNVSFSQLVCGTLHHPAEAHTS